MFALVLLFPITMYSQCILTSDTENVIGTDLVGEWRLNPVLTNNLCPNYIGWLDVTSVLFSYDPRIVDALPAEDCEMMIDFPLYLSGKMTLIRGNNTEPEPTAHPYVLSSLDGYPHLIYWQEELTTESFNLSMAKAEDKNTVWFWLFEISGHF